MGFGQGDGLSVGIVVPEALGEVDVLLVRGLHHRRNEEVLAVHKLLIQRIGIGIVGILHQHGAEQGQTGATAGVTLHPCAEDAVGHVGIEVGRELVAKADIFLGSLFAPRDGPWLFGAAAAVVEAVHGRERRQLNPALVLLREVLRVDR